MLRLCAHPLPFLEELLQPCGGHADQQEARLRANVLKRVDVISRQEDERAGRCLYELFAKLELELPFQDIEELVLSPMDVGGRPTLGGNLDPEDAKRALGALARGEDLCDVPLSRTAKILKLAFYAQLYTNSDRSRRR
jgi:hypothetical protein